MLLHKRAPSERAGGALCPALSLRAVAVAVLPSGDALGAPLPAALWLRRYRGGLPPAPPAHSGQLASSPMSFFSVLSPIWAVLCAPERLPLTLSAVSITQNRPRSVLSQNMYMFYNIVLKHSRKVVYIAENQ